LYNQPRTLIWKKDILVALEDFHFNPNYQMASPATLHVISLKSDEKKKNKKSLRLKSVFESK